MTSICRCAFQALAWGLRSARSSRSASGASSRPRCGQAKDARGTWSGLKLTQKDLDSVSDDVWEIIAAELSVRWRYAAKPVERGAEPVAALG